MKLFRKLFHTKETCAYRKMHRRHRRELIKLAKKDAEWDWEFLHTLVITKVRHMYEYYEAGNNVWQVDEERLKTVAELKHVLDLQEELDGLFDKYHPEITAQFTEDGKLRIIEDEDSERRSDEMFERKDELYKEIYCYIAEHLRGWWD